MKFKKSQVWIETVIYTLIAFSLIGVALSVVKPKVESIQDKTVLDQTVALLQGVDNVIRDVEQTGVDNRRRVDITIKKGMLNIDGKNNVIEFKLDNAVKPYSEPGKELDNGGVIINTEQIGELYNIYLKLNYSEEYDITFQGTDTSKLINPSQRAYAVFIENNGKINSTDKLKINFEVS